MTKRMLVIQPAAQKIAKTDVVTGVPAETISHRAYTLFQTRGGEHGHDIEDWLLAEADLRKGNHTEVALPSADI